MSTLMLRLLPLATRTPPSLLSSPLRLASLLRTIPKSPSFSSSSFHTTSTQFLSSSPPPPIISPPQSPDECFQKYLILQNKIAAEKEAQEQAAMNQQIAAANQANANSAARLQSKQPQPSPSSSIPVPPPQSTKAGGVAVIKTIAKQARKTQKTTLVASDSYQLDLLLKTSAELGHVEGMVLWGNRLLEMVNIFEVKGKSEVMEHVNEALMWYLKSDCNEGYFNAGHIYYDGHELGEVEADVGKAMECFNKGVDGGDPDAMYFVGVATMPDDEDDEENASANANANIRETLARTQYSLNLISKSASLNHGGAMHYLALHKLNDVNNPSSPAQFKSDLVAAADVGSSPDAMNLIGQSYYQGANGFELDLLKALKYWKESADHGNADAAVSAGVMLYNGEGGGKNGKVRDMQGAFEMYQLAGELGSEEGWRNVAACYALGEGVAKSESTAKYIMTTMFKKE